MINESDTLTRLAQQKRLHTTAFLYITALGDLTFARLDYVNFEFIASPLIWVKLY